MKNEKRSTTNLSREEFIKKKSRKTLFFLDLAMLVIGLVSILPICIFKTNSIMDFWQMILVILLLIVILDFASIKFLYFLSSSDFDRAIGLDILNKSLSSKIYTEVVPLHGIYEHSYFLVSLTNIAKFYAIIKNESEVSIYVKFNTEDELQFLEDIPKEKFHVHYKLK